MTAGNGRQQSNSGSPRHGEPEYLLVGSLRRPHGVRGEMLMHVVTDFPERLQPGAELYVGKKHRPTRIIGRRDHARGLILLLEGYDSPEAASTLRNQPVFVRTADRPSLPEGQYYHHELLGSAVLDQQRGPIGTLVEILQTGANDVYVVHGHDKTEILLPVIPGVALGFDPESRTITVRIPEGLGDSKGS